MEPDELKPGDFHFRAGTKTELDRNFLRIIAREKPPDVNMSTFIKQVVVRYFEPNPTTRPPEDEIQRIRKELEERIIRLENLIRQGAPLAGLPSGEIASGRMELSEETESLLKALTMAF